MSTALVYFFTDEGFVIAADGFNTLVSREGRQVTSDRAQKIFPVRGIEREAALSFTGRTTLYDQTESYVAFDFPSAFVSAAHEIRFEPVENVSAFLSELCLIVLERLELTRLRVGLSKYPSPPNRLNPAEHTIISIHLDGYCSGYPVRAGATVYHINQEVAWDANSLHSLNCPKRYWSVLHGSDSIGALLFDTSDARLAQYRTEACRRVAANYKDSNIGITLQDAIEAARNYIAACSDPAIREIDIENCRGIGGRIHIATITPKDGFQWVPGLEPHYP
jgi:hypothetical protein